MAAKLVVKVPRTMSNREESNEKKSWKRECRGTNNDDDENLRFERMQNQKPTPRDDRATCNIKSIEERIKQCAYHSQKVHVLSIQLFREEKAREG